MKPAGPAARPPRRVLLLGAVVTLALHLVLLVLLLQPQLPPAGPADEAAITLVTLPPLPDAVALAARPAPVRPPPAPATLPPDPPSASTPPADPPVPAQQDAATDLAGSGTDDAHQADSAPASVVLSDAALAALALRAAQDAAAPVPPAAPTPPAPAELPAGMRAALAGLPQQGEVDYQVSMGSGDWQVARGTLRWRIDGLRYHLDLTAQAVGLARLLKSNAVSQISEGRITAAGLVPEHFRVLGRAVENGEENARFDWPGGQLTFLPSGQSQALPEGTQDLLSFFMQFALLPPQADTLLQPVTNGRKLDRYTFEMTERGPLHLPVGVFDTVHISKLHAANEDDFDVWLAQDRHYLPVQMRFRARGRLLTLSATAIRVAGLHSAL